MHTVGQISTLLHRQIGYNINHVRQDRLINQIKIFDINCKYYRSYEDKVAQAQELEKKNQELYRTIKTLEEEIQNKDDVKQSSEQAEILLKEKEELLERVEQLELQLEQRAIKGNNA